MLASLFFTFVCILGTQTATAGVCFSPGESARYQVRWLFVVAGHVDIAVQPDDQQADPTSRHFSLTAQTLPFIDIFHKVRDQIDAFTDREVTHSLVYQKVQSGSSNRDIEILFDWRNRTARYRNFDKSEPPVSIPKGTLDPLSAYFYMRTLDFSTDDEISRPVTDGKKLVIGHARILGRERIKVPAGEFDCFLVEPDMKEVRGVFEKEKNARLLVWLTADCRHLLVRAKSKVVVGSFVAELVSVTPPDSK